MLFRDNAALCALVLDLQELIVVHLARVPVKHFKIRQMDASLVVDLIAFEYLIPWVFAVRMKEGEVMTALEAESSQNSANCNIIKEFVQTLAPKYLPPMNEWKQAHSNAERGPQLPVLRLRSV